MTPLAPAACSSIRANCRKWRIDSVLDRSAAPCESESVLDMQSDEAGDDRPGCRVCWSPSGCIDWWIDWWVDEELELPLPLPPLSVALRSGLKVDELAKE